MLGRIVVTLDGSARSEAALPWAAAVARAARAPLDLVHVHVPWMPEAGFAEAAEPWLRPPETPPADEAYTDVPHPSASEKRAWLEELAAEATWRTAVAASPHLLEGPLIPTLRRFIEESGADLLVMTSRGQGAGGPTWLGSVARSFAHDADVPLLLVPLPADGEVKRWRQPAVRRILVALDGSPASESVLGPAASLATTFGAAILLLLVLPLDATDADRRAAEAYLARVAARLPPQPAPPETRVAIHGQPAAAILHVVRSERMDVVAAGSHGESGISRMLLGGAAQEMLRGADVPLLLVRAPAAG